MQPKTQSVIVSGARLAMGSFQGGLSSFSAPDLGGLAIKEALARIHNSSVAEQINEVIMGCVLSGGLGQAPARQAAKKSGLGNHVGAVTINKVCGSSLKAVLLADQMIRCGDVSVVVAGGMESMTQAPYFLAKARAGYRMGHGTLIDSMIHDGLWDPYHDFHMGNAAEMCARKFSISREAQDAVARRSYERAVAAAAAGDFAREIGAIQVSQGKDTLLFKEDEEPAKGYGKIGKMSQLKPVFEANGTVTAANASKISDGAAALVIMHPERAKEFGIKPRLRIVAHAQAALAPEDFTIAPIAALKNLLKVSGKNVAEIDRFEINEAFAVVVEVAIRELNLDPEKVNCRGGAIALGHPIGMSGARLIVTLMDQLEKDSLRYGAASICLGGGEAVAILVERV